MIFVSTTYYKKKFSKLDLVLSELSNLRIDGIEIGSTHEYDTHSNLKKIIKNVKSKKIFIHNFFPPLKEKNFVINISSENKKIRNDSIDMIINNIDFCNDVNALLYTIHPGFLSFPLPSVDLKNKNYDFQFLDNTFVSNKKGYETMILSLKKIANYASSNKMKLAIETQGSLQKKDFLLMQRPIEFKKLFNEIPNNIYINLNLAHTYFASLSYRFSIIKFIKFIESKVEAVELSCNDGIHDQHLPIKANSKNLNFLKYLKNKPIILEFRNCNLSTLNKSINFLNANI